MKKLTDIIYFGLLQTITIFTSTILIGQLAGLNIPVVLFATGIGCIVFTALTRGKIPIALGTSGSWLATTITMSAFGLDHVIGVAILGGLWYVLFGLLIKWKPQILSLFTPLILNLAVMFIAFNLMSTAVGLLVEYPITGAITFIAIEIFINIKKTSKYAFPIGVLIGTIAHSFMYGLTSSMLMSFSPEFVMPAFNMTTFMASLIFIALVTEALGDSKLVADVTDRGFEPHNVIIGNGVVSILSAFVGCMSLTTYSESAAVVKATKYTNAWSIVVCGGLFIVMAFVPQVSYVVGFIPQAVFAGLLLYLFTMVAASKIHDVKFETTTDASIAIMGLGFFFLAPNLLPQVSQIAAGMIAMIITYSVWIIKDKFKSRP